jgi:hypothetical protein
MMRNVNQVCGVIALIAVGCLAAFGSAVGQEHNGVTTALAGRFQIVTGLGDLLKPIFLLDTETGDTWRYVGLVGSDGNQWWWKKQPRINQLSPDDWDWEVKGNLGLEEWERLRAGMSPTTMPGDE